MLSLDSPQWSELQHAYGPATDIPQLLRVAYASALDQLPLLVAQAAVKRWDENFLACRSPRR